RPKGGREHPNICLAVKREERKHVFGRGTLGSSFAPDRLRLRNKRVGTSSVARLDQQPCLDAQGPLEVQWDPAPSREVLRMFDVFECALSVAAGEPDARTIHATQGLAGCWA